jgi:thiol-disulfide isomerase/thioredoxin
MMRKWMFLAALPLAVACGDSDGDGLSAKEEKDIGSDPKVADTDGDGLNDGAEVTAGTSATTPDTDADGFIDGDEVAIGADPTDPASFPYKGGWPNLPGAEKQAIEDSGPSGAEATEGKRFKRYTMIDQFGDEVDLYDFAHAGVPIIIDVSAEWCPPCNDMADWVATGESGVDWESALGSDLRPAIEEGRVTWLTILSENDDYEIADPNTAKRWYREHRDPKVPVFSDTTGNPTDFAAVGFFPSLFLLDENMNILARDPQDANAAPAGQIAIGEMFGG